MLRRSHIAAHSLCSSSCSDRSKKMSAPLPIFSATPRSLFGAIDAPNPPSRPLWPIPPPTSSTPLGEQTFGDAPRDPRSIPGSSVPNPCPCPLLGSLHPTTGERDEEIACPRGAVAS